jgi:hypothetical protein
VAAQTLKFESKVDRLLMVAIAVPLAASTIGAVVISLREPIVWVVAGLMLLADAFVAWTYLGTSYSIGEGELRVRSGPFEWRVALREIRSVLPSGSLLSSPALSLDRLEIRHGSGGAILVSPARRTAFLESLAQLSPGLVKEGGGLRRVAPHEQ